MYFKKMIGKKCYLSPINVEDYEKYTEWITDMEVAVGMLFSTSLVTPVKEKEMLARLSSEGYNFAIVDLDKDELIGNVGFPRIDTINRVAELGIFIGNKNYWGNGYGTEAIQLLLDYGFNVLNMNTIFLKVFSYNQPAINCYKKVGFQEAGRIRESKQIAGEKYDEIYMDILAREFESIYIKDLVDEKNVYKF